MDFVFNWEGNKKNIVKLKEFMKDNKKKKGALMMVLHEAQEMFGYIPVEIQNLISEGMKVPLSEIYGVVTFYSQFSLIPKGENVVNVCLGTACYVKGAQDILDKIEESLEISVAQTTPDGKFSIDGTRCLGACGLAPIIMINGDTYGRLKTDDIEEIINTYR